MNSYKPIIFILIIIILVGWGYLYMTKNDSVDSKDQNIVLENEDLVEDVLINEESELNRNNTAGTYEAYSVDKLTKAETGSVILFFRASWCPTCRTLDQDIKDNLNNIPSGVAILDVDYDNATALKQKYGVTYQHTLVQVDSVGNQINKWTGSPTLSALVSNIK